MATWGPKLIPRKTLNGRRSTQTVDEFGLTTDSSPTSFTVDNAGVQPVPGDQLDVFPEGYRDRRKYKVYTTTPVFTVEEGSNKLPDQIEVETGIWCDVVRVESWGYGLQAHYLAFVAQENER